MGEKIGTISPEGLAYLHGRIEHEIECYAAALHCPANELTERLAALLLHSGLRSASPMSDLRRRSTKGNQTLAKMEMASGTHRHKASSRGHSKIKEYWSRMTPEERSAEVKRRLRKGKRKAA